MEKSPPTGGLSSPAVVTAGKRSQRVPAALVAAGLAGAAIGGLPATASAQSMFHPPASSDQIGPLGLFTPDELAVATIATLFEAPRPLSECSGYSQCPIINFQTLVADDPQVIALNNNITQVENQTLALIDSGRYDTSPSGAASMLGKVMIYDRTLSVNDAVACATCHSEQEGFTGGSSILNLLTVDNPGAVGSRINNRKPMSYGYAPFAPVAYYRASTGDFVGGNFWDDRATGLVTGNPAADQALGPPLNPGEMANPDEACIVYHISKSPYRALFETVWGAGSLDFAWPADTASICATPGNATSTTAELVPLPSSERAQVTTAYHEFGLSVASYESSSNVSAFTSKFDYVQKGEAKLTPTEQLGYQLFNGKAQCSACHSDTGSNPLFTDFTAVNEGIPKNTTMPYYSENKPDSYGFTLNPAGAGFTDDGVGAFMAGSGNPTWVSLAPKFMGTFQVATLRNVAQMAPGIFVKNYMHNGYFKSLKQVVHWYNTAAALPTCPASVGPTVAGRVGTSCWPAPEVPSNVNRTQMGNLGLTDAEENAIVAFMGTLTDGYTPSHGA